jgi:hypothetical protein
LARLKAHLDREQAKDDRKVRSLQGVLSQCEAVQASSQRDHRVNDKSPRQSMSKKSGKSIKQKRADTRTRASAKSLSEQIHPAKKK